MGKQKQNKPRTKRSSSTKRASLGSTDGKESADAVPRPPSGHRSSMSAMRMERGTSASRSRIAMELMKTSNAEQLIKELQSKLEVKEQTTR